MIQARLFRYVALLLLIPFLPASAQNGDNEPGIDISQLFNGFVLSSVAANECEKPKDPHLSQFLKNFQLVWVTAAKEVEKRFPGKTEKEIAAAMKKQTELLTERVNQVIEAEGCEGEKIKQLIQGFYVYAKWAPQSKQ